MHALLEEQPPDIITFTSGSTAAGFVEILGKKKAAEVCERATVASIGPMTSDVIRKYGLRVDVEAEIHSVSGVVEAILDYRQNR
jgi:uroporphyrinogen-III synthase